MGVRRGSPADVGPTRLTLHCRPQEKAAPYHRYKKGGSVGGVCYLSMVVLLWPGVPPSTSTDTSSWAQAKVGRRGGAKQWPLEEEVNPTPRWEGAHKPLKISPSLLLLPGLGSRRQDWGAIL